MFTFYLILGIIFGVLAVWGSSQTEPVFNSIGLISLIPMVYSFYLSFRWLSHYKNESKEVKDILDKRGPPTLPKGFKPEEQSKD